jgi:prohibitin 2
MQVSRLVRENLTNRALRFNLVLDDVSITHVAFSPEFTHAVEAKQVRARAIPCIETRSICSQDCATNRSSSRIPCGSGYSREAGNFICHLVDTLSC